MSRTFPNFENKKVMKMYYMSIVGLVISALGVYLGMEILGNMVITVIFWITGAISTLTFGGITAAWELHYKMKF